LKEINTTSKNPFLLQKLPMKFTFVRCGFVSGRPGDPGSWKAWEILGEYQPFKIECWYFRTKALIFL
jgi:hypothetical protein